jgi:hypothetical protein
VDTDPLLRRVERTAMAICAATAALALLVPRNPTGAALAVLAGGLLIAVSYWSIKSGISGLFEALSSPQGGGVRRISRWRIALQLAGRYALLALLAYVMIVRLRLHPLGLLAGVSSVVAAVAVEAVRLLAKKS